MKSDSVHIGVDVSKAKLDVYVPAKQEGLRATTFEVANDIAGFRRLRDVAKSAKEDEWLKSGIGQENRKRVFF